LASTEKTKNQKPEEVTSKTTTTSV